jgi:hypothetical protein
MDKGYVKWKCEVGTCIVTYCAKWLLTKHLKEVYGLVVENAKPGKPSTFERSPQHQDHVKMNVCILRNVMAMQRWNDQKVISHVCAQAYCKFLQQIFPLLFLEPYNHPKTTKLNPNTPWMKKIIKKKNIDYCCFLPSMNHFRFMEIQYKCQLFCPTYFIGFSIPIFNIPCHL